MAGTSEGNKKAAETTKKRHGDDFYKKAGAKSWSNPDRSRKQGFALNPELASAAGRAGGRAKNSKRIYIGDTFARVDAEDYDELLAMGKWHLSTNGYAVRRGPVDGVKKTIRMHRLVMNTPDGFDTDHINHDKLDNRKTNLRICSRSENLSNRGALVGCWFDKRRGTYQVEFKVENTKYYVGAFDDRDLACHVGVSIRDQLLGESINRHAEKAEDEEIIALLIEEAGASESE